MPPWSPGSVDLAKKMPAEAAAPIDAGRAQIAALYDALDGIAPFGLAADWDNVGLLAGARHWPAARILLAIDLTDAVAGEALERGCDALVLYHPPIFKGIRAITSEAEAPTRRLPELLRAGISLLALHTALDAADGGTNDVLLDFFAPVSRRPLELSVAQGRHLKLVVFVLPNEVDALRRALSAAGAGVIGHYGECSYVVAGQGTFRGDETTNPTVGRKLELEHVDELRLEMIVPRARLGDVIRALYATHSYEEPAFDLYPLDEVPARGTAGMGRVGLLARPLRGDRLLRKVAEHVDPATVRSVGDLKRPFRSVTAAAGSFGVRSFRDPESLVVTGELKHHDALELVRRGVAALLLGHWGSERPALDRLRSRLAERMPHSSVEIATTDRDPFAVFSTK